jgi:hypothetical protein
MLLGFECARQCSSTFVIPLQRGMFTSTKGLLPLNYLALPPITAAVCMRVYGGPANRLDEYFRMEKSTILETVNQFTHTIIDIYGATYLRQPNADDIARLFHIGEQQGFSGMLGSLDCMYWELERCPMTLHGQYRGHFKKPTIILEVVASADL